MNPAESCERVPLLIVVRRGATERFRFLEAEFVNASVRVVWDRRVGERRQRELPAEERRQGERRGQPPASWSTLDFVVAREGGP
jgi:hypothetical protein